MEIFDYLGTFLFGILTIFSIVVACLSEKTWQKIIDKE